MNKSLDTHHAELNIHQEKVRLTFRLLVISTLVIFSLETLYMIVERFYFVIPQPLDLVLDGIILVACLFPLNYYFIFKPMIERVDKHRLTNQQLRSTNKILEQFFSISGVFIAYLDANFNFIRVNNAYASMDNRTPDQFPGMNHFDLFPDQENEQIFRMVVQTGIPYHAIEKPFIFADHPERGIRYLDWSLVPVKGLDELVTALILVLTDVTARMQAQGALAESERRFRAVFNQTFQQMGLLDPKGELLLLNQTALDYSGLSDLEYKGKLFWQIPWWVSTDSHPLDIIEQIQTAIQEAAGGKVAHCELQVKSKSGTQSTMDISFKPLLDDQGSTSLIIYEARDITLRIHAEQALIRSEKEILHLYEAEIRAHKHADALRSAVQALSGSLDSTKILEILIDHIYKVVSYTSARILMLEDEYHLVVRLARGEENRNLEERLINVRFDTGRFPFLNTVLIDNEILSVSSDKPEPDFAIFQDDIQILSWLAIPIQASDKVIGICLLGHRCPGFFIDELVQWSFTLTRQAAVAIQNAWLFEQVRDNREHLQALSRRLVESQEFERNYIARELHDDAGQVLASLMFGLRHLELDSQDPVAVIEHCREMKQITDGLLEDLHRLAINLRPAALDHLGLVAALRQYGEMIGLQDGLAIQFEAIGPIERLPGEIETAIYRIVQESLTNIIRHAQASRVDILLERREKHLVVLVEDDGIGFDPQVPQISQLGVLGMRERADMLGGTITIESSSGKGSTVILEVPWPSES